MCLTHSYSVVFFSTICQVLMKLCLYMFLNCDVMYFSHCRQFTFVVLFSTFMLICVNYDVLFKEGKYTSSQKVTIADAIYPVDTWTSRY